MLLKMSNKKSQLSKSLELFNLKKVDRDIFSWTGKNVGYKRIFGGQVMAQTLIAAVSYTHLTLPTKRIV